MFPDNDTAYTQYAKTCAAVYPPDDFEGLFVKYNVRTQKLQFRGYFDKNLRRQGQHICFWESGALQEVSHWKDGWAVGVLVRYYENGTRDIEIHYGINGGRNQKFVEIHYGYLNDKIHYIWELNGYEVIREWSEVEAARMWELIGGDKIVEDAVREMGLEDVTKDKQQSDDDE